MSVLGGPERRLDAFTDDLYGIAQFAQLVGGWTAARVRSEG